MSPAKASASPVLVKARIGTSVAATLPNQPSMKPCDTSTSVKAA
jgi:hypothetical protein